MGLNGGRAGLRAWLKRCLRWRGSSCWPVLAFLLPLAVLTLAAAARMALSGSLLPSLSIDYVGLLVAQFFWVF